MMKDEGLLGQIYELQKDMAVTQQKIKIYDSHIFQVKKMIEKCKITNREIDSLTPNHRTYRLLGTTFFLSDKERIKTDLENSIVEQEKEINEYQKLRGHFENKFKDAEKQLKELASAGKAQKKDDREDGFLQSG
eukprot:TRINITY_DN397_c0_g1_i10.p2 TRINITY_DN397_c0_g1~~TRINITY_DN397_c0_g1_i10.p2  ORF type:complete len:134 (+),score=36.65 TRINITY_DN397_c0_g1_i10:103-504(+)